MGQDSKNRGPLRRTFVESRLLATIATCALLPLAGYGVLHSWDGAMVLLGESMHVAAPLFGLLIFLVASLLAIRQIQRQLLPLRDLTQLTRVYREHLPKTISTTTRGDEFEELGDFFELMTSELGDQVEILNRMVDASRALHSALDASALATAVVTRLRHIYPCECIAIALVRPEDGEVRTFFSEDEESVIERVEGAPLQPEDVDFLAANPDCFDVDTRVGALPCVDALGSSRVNRFLVLPLFQRDALAGFIALGQANPSECDEKKKTYVRHLRDQASAALENARVLAENRELAYYDSLTGLPNRRMYKMALEEALRVAGPGNDRVATCFVDLDRFKNVNDAMGHDAGDQLLCEVSRRLARAVRLTDSVARLEPEDRTSISRLGGDEFTILLRRVSSVENVAHICQRVLDSLSEPFEIEGQQVFVPPSIGVAIYPLDGNDAESLLRHADTAMYAAKRRGGNSFQFYAESMNAEVSRKLQLETRLRLALERREFSLVYQPMIDVRSGSIVGAEALLRWDDPEMGEVGPQDFIPVAEETGVIVKLGDWVLERACRDRMEWEAEGFGSTRVGVNLSTHQLTTGTFVESVDRILRRTGMEARFLELEITESAIMEDDDETIETLEGLRARGIGLALDDFGTGYSSLSYLRRFPIDRVKIDRSFVKEIPENEGDMSLTTAIIAMAHGLGMAVVAEGVETREQEHFLCDRGCDELQGYRLGRPIPAAEFGRLLEKGAAQ